VEVANGKVTKVHALPGVYEHAGCMVPVNLLTRHGIKILIAGEMGKPPLLGLQSGRYRRLPEWRRRQGRRGDAFMSGSLPKFCPEYSCGSLEEGGCQG
jgi:hypothetical protein